MVFLQYHFLIYFTHFTICVCVCVSVCRHAPVYGGQSKISGVSYGETD